MSGNTAQLHIKALDNVRLSDSEKGWIEEKMHLAVTEFASQIWVRFGDDKETWVVM